MKLVLDTSALWDKPLRDALAAAHAEGATSDGRLTAILPAVAYGERLRQLAQEGRDVATWKRRLVDMGLSIEPFSEAQAERIAMDPLDDPTWRRHARDALIAAHVTDDRTAVTSDGGPVWASVDTIAPADATRAVLALLGEFP